MGMQWTMKDLLDKDMAKKFAKLKRHLLILSFSDLAIRLEF